MTGHARAGARTAHWALRILTAAGLGVDAVIHLSLASTRPPGGSISQAQLFYLEGAASIVVLAWVLARGSRIAYGLAFLVAASALVAVVLYRYVDVGTLGPLPDMYEPFWYAKKTATAVAEGIAVLLSAIGVLVTGRAARRGR